MSMKTTLDEYGAMKHGYNETEVFFLLRNDGSLD